MTNTEMDVAAALLVLHGLEQHGCVNLDFHIDLPRCQFAHTAAKEVGYTPNPNRVMPAIKERGVHYVKENPYYGDQEVPH